MIKHPKIAPKDTNLVLYINGIAKSKPIKIYGTITITEPNPVATPSIQMKFFEIYYLKFQYIRLIF